MSGVTFHYIHQRMALNDHSATLNILPLKYFGKIEFGLQWPNYQCEFGQFDPKAGRTTFFSSFQPFVFISKLFRGFLGVAATRLRGHKGKLT